MIGPNDPARLGRGIFTRWLPVLWQAPAEPPGVEPFPVDGRTSPQQFLLRVISSVPRLTIPAAISGILWQVGEALVPVVMGFAIDEALATGDTRALLFWLAILAAVFLVLSLAFRFSAQLAALATELAQHRLRATLSRAVLHVDGAGARQPDGGVVSMMTNDVTRLANLGLAVYPTAELAGVVFIAISLLLIHWPLGIAVLVGAPATVWLMGRLSGQLARDSRIYQTILANTVGRATDLVAGYRVIKGMRAEVEAARRYREASQQTLTGAYRNVGLLGRFLLGSNIVSGIFTAAVVGLAGWLALDGQLSLGELIAAVGLAQALLAPMRMLAMNAVPAWAGAIASSGRVLDALKAAPGEASDQQPLPAAPPTTPMVELSIAGHGVLRIAPGELLGLRADERLGAAIAGALLNPPQEGPVQVSLDGASARDLSPRAYRAAVMVSPHHAMLFSGTVAETLAAPDASPDLQAAALHTAACEDFIATIGGINGQVGEMGKSLSGGQRQRLALARALAGDAPVLVLHDPTTAVDSVTEAAIASRLYAIRQCRSTILITSSPAMLGICDRIVDLRRPDGVEGDAR